MKPPCEAINSRVASAEGIMETGGLLNVIPVGLNGVRQRGWYGGASIRVARVGASEFTVNLHWRVVQVPHKDKPKGARGGPDALFVDLAKQIVGSISPFGGVGVTIYQNHSGAHLGRAAEGDSYHATVLIPARIPVGDPGVPIKGNPRPHHLGFAPHISAHR